MHVQSGPIACGELLRCGFVVMAANCTPPVSEVIPRWRRSMIYLALFVGLTTVAVWQGTPLWLAPVFVVVLIAGSFSLAVAAVHLVHRADSRIWRAWDGASGGVVIIQWSPSRRRHEMHSWAAFPRRRGLGAAVAAAALDEGPRPLWLDPATPDLRETYRGRGFVDVPGTRWMRHD